MTDDPEGFRHLGGVAAQLVATAQLARIARLHAERRAPVLGDGERPVDAPAATGGRRAADSAGRA